MHSRPTPPSERRRPRRRFDFGRDSRRSPDRDLGGEFGRERGGDLDRDSGFACRNCRVCPLDVGHAAEQSRYIPAAVRRAVWDRDGGRCAFVSKDGKRCNSTHRLEVHHIDPHARGGPATVENLSLRCRTHNLYEAELAFGADFMRSLPFWRCEDSLRPHLHCDAWSADDAAPH